MEIIGDKRSIECKNVEDIWITIIRIHGLLNKIQISISEEKILAYFCRWGIDKNIEDKILDDYVVSSKQILSNLKTSLLKKKLIEKTASNKYDVISALRFPVNNQTYFLLLRLFSNVPD